MNDTTSYTEHAQIRSMDTQQFQTRAIAYCENCGVAKSHRGTGVPGSAGGGGRAQDTSTSSSSSPRSEPASRRDEEAGGGEDGMRDSSSGAGAGRWSGMSGGGIMTGESPSDAGGDAAAGPGSAEVTKPTWRNRGSTPPEEERGGGRRMSIAGAGRADDLRGEERTAWCSRWAVRARGPVCCGAGPAERSIPTLCSRSSSTAIKVSARIIGAPAAVKLKLSFHVD